MRQNMILKGKKIRYSFLALLITVIFIGTTAALPFSIGAGDKDEYRFIVGAPGEIRVQAAWTGTASNLALILNGPGQVSAYARQDGSSPLELRYTVTSADVAKGETWTIGIWNFGGGTADGDISLTSPGYPFSLGFTSADKVEIYFTVRSPGLISAQASWTGSSSDLDLSLNGPGNFGTHALGASPLGKGYMVTNDDLLKGQTWTVTLENHERDQWSTASGTIRLTYPGECSWTGTWNTNFGEMELKQEGAIVTGTYTHDQGRIRGTVSGNTLTGTWSEAPSYSPTQDAGKMQLVMSEDCNSFRGYWMYGQNKANWDGDWTGTRARGSSDLRPSGAGIFG
jgi:hypothetical protein